MKVACVFYGQPRNYTDGYDCLMKFLKNQENVQVDFFYHCWILKDGDKFTPAPWREIYHLTLYYKETTVEHLKELYNPISCEYEYQHGLSFDTSIYKDTLAYKNTEKQDKKIRNMQNILFQLYSRNKARNLFEKYVIDTNTQYDLVIMTRFDIDSIPNLKLTELDRSKVYVSNLWRPRNTIPDNFIISPQQVFIKWMNIYEEIGELLNDEILYAKIKELGEGLDINAEELIVAKYILHYKNMDNIVFYQR